MKDSKVTFSVRVYERLQRILDWAEKNQKETPTMNPKAKTLLKVCGVTIVAGLILYGATYLVPTSS